MAVLSVNPTRMELSKLKRKLQTARKGHSLLKDKRDELMRRFLELVRENKILRAEVEAEIAEANRHMAVAAASMADYEIVTALSMPKQTVSLQVVTKNIMSVDIPVYNSDFRSDSEGDVYSYGYAYTSCDLDSAVKALSDVFPKMLRLAEIEKSCSLMAAEIERTRRRVNALEHVLIPDYTDTVKYITMKLDENERSSTSRLMKVKDMMLNEAHNYNDKT